MTNAAYVECNGLLLKSLLNKDKRTQIALLKLYRKLQPIPSFRDRQHQTQTYIRYIFLRIHASSPFISINRPFKMFLSRFAVLCTLPLLALGMNKRAESSTFGLYGYAPGGLGGYPLYYADGT